MNFPTPPLTGTSMPTPPNKGITDGDKAGSLPQPESAAPYVRPTNYGMGGDRRNGTMPLGGSHGAIVPPNNGGFSLGKS